MEQTEVRIPGNKKWEHSKFCGFISALAHFKIVIRSKDYRVEALCKTSAFSCPNTFVHFTLLIMKRKHLSGTVNILFKDWQSLSRCCYVLCKMRIRGIGRAHLMTWIYNLFLSYLVWTTYSGQKKKKIRKMLGLGHNHEWEATSFFRKWWAPPVRSVLTGQIQKSAHNFLLQDCTCFQHLHFLPTLLSRTVCGMVRSVFMVFLHIQ